MGWLSEAWAQDSVRMSLAGAEAAEARRKAATTIGYYNVKAGPTAWRFSTALASEWSDNIRLDPSNPLSDVSFRPEVGMRMMLPITDQNSFSLALSGGYTAYAQHSEYDRFFVRPGSELSFDLYAGDVWMSFHDRFSITDDSYQDPTVVGNADLSRLENAVGTVVTWDLNEGLVRAGYDHLNYSNLSGNTDNYPGGRSEVFFLNAGLTPGVGVLYGVELGGSLIHYDERTSNGFENASQWNAGAFTDLQISEYIRARANAGYTVFSPEKAGLFYTPEDFSGIYAQLSIMHRLNQFLDYTLTGGRNLNFTFYGGTVDLWYLRLEANWHVLDKVTLSTSFGYERGEQLDIYSERFNRLGPGIRASRSITQKLVGFLQYQYYWRESDLPNRDYTVNIVTLGLQYTF